MELAFGVPGRLQKIEILEYGKEINLKNLTGQIFQKLISRPTKNRLVPKNLKNRFFPKKIDFFIFLREIDDGYAQKKTMEI